MSSIMSADLGVRPRNWIWGHLYPRRSRCLRQTQSSGGRSAFPRQCFHAHQISGQLHSTGSRTAAALANESGLGRWSTRSFKRTNRGQQRALVGANVGPSERGCWRYGYPSLTAAAKARFFEQLGSLAPTFLDSDSERRRRRRRSGR